jgi:hypothetical protein
MLNEHLQAVIGVVHYIFVNVRNDPKPQRPGLFRFLARGPAENRPSGNKRCAPEDGALEKIPAINRGAM